MKTGFIKISFSLLLLSVLGVGCEKNNEDGQNSNIPLYDKPLSTIKSNIQGKWELHYGKGGICATCIQYVDSTYWEFTNNDKILKYYDKDIVLDTSIMWYKDVDNFSGLTYIMQFYDNYGYPSNYVIDGIYEDTLIIHDFSSDAVFYHFTKQ